MMNLYEMRTALGDTQSDFSARYNIPFRTIQNWETGRRTPPKYVTDLLESRVNADLVNHRTFSLPKHNSKKIDLPKQENYVSVTSWLRSIRECIGDDFVFALDEALMCQGRFLGRSDEYIIWGYGDPSALHFNGVVLLGSQVNCYDIKEEKGLRFTNFNRTLADALANEDILDMQGITEALSHYYYTNNNSFEGIFVTPEYADRFSKLAIDAINYYES